MDLRPGTLVAGTYEIVGPLGRGGMGEIWKARNTRTERMVALKLLRPDNKHREDVIERFRREARAAGMIKSDHVTQVLGVEDDPELGVALVFELLEGESLLDHLKRTGPMGFERLSPIVQQILRGLQAAHAVDVVHRDLKPSNVFLEQRADEPDRVKILDFGISKLPKTLAKTTLTEPGQSLGSFMFMPPEQIQRAATVDLRADIYALGTLVFQAMTGHLPYSTKNMVDLVAHKATRRARAMTEVSRRGFAPELEAWVARCLEIDPSQRFQTAREALDAWKALDSAPSEPSRPSTAMRQSTAVPGDAPPAPPSAPVGPPTVNDGDTRDQTVREPRPKGLGGTLVIQNPLAPAASSSPRRPAPLQAAPPPPPVSQVAAPGWSPPPGPSSGLAPPAPPSRAWAAPTIADPQHGAVHAAAHAQPPHGGRVAAPAPPHALGAPHAGVAPTARARAAAPSRPSTGLVLAAVVMVLLALGVVTLVVLVLTGVVRL